MIFYHGTDDHNVVEKAKRKCPSMEHSYGFTPSRMVSTAPHYFIDNGAFTQDFDKHEWTNALDKIVKKYSNKPDFVVLPDVFGKWKETRRRNMRWASECRDRDLPFYVVAQNDAKADEVVEFALNMNAKGIFIGGYHGWKERFTKNVVDIAHRNDLKVHIGKPGNYLWGYRSGADSMDSVSIARNKNYKRLENLQYRIDEQTTLQQL